MTPPAVEITGTVPGGSVIYREGGHAHEFGWDLGGRDVVMAIYVPSPADWDARLPWAAGRRQQVLDFMAREVRRRKARGCRIEMHERWIHLVEPAPWPLRLWRALTGRARRRTPSDPSAPA